MKRRRFIQAIVATPTAGALLAQNPATNPTQNPAPNPAATPVVNPGGGRGRGNAPGGASPIPEFPLTDPQLTADPNTAYFKPDQYAALRKMSEIMMPPMKGNLGALDCQVPEFLDFLVREGTPALQTLYKTGLDGLNSAAKKQFSKPFGDLDKTQADAILKPLMVARPWAYEWPSDPMKHFVAQAHMHIRQATTNSREWAMHASGGAGGRGGRGGGGGGAAGGAFWLPVDPIYKG